MCRWLRMLALGLLAATSACERPAEASRPNILIVIVDDLASGAVGALSRGKSVTPNLDELARGSVVYEHAVVATPLCTPSRNAFLTGRWPHEIGVTQLYSQLPLGTPTLATLFQDAGYATAAIGKMHWYRGRLGDETFGFERIVDKKDWEDGLDAEERAVWDARKASWSQQTTSFEARFNLSGEPLAIAQERQCASFLVEETLRFVDANEERPFLAVCSFYEPHAPFNFPESLADRVRPEDVTPPAFDAAAAVASVPGLAAYYANHETRYGKLTDDRVRSMTASYLRSVAWVDDRIGKLLAGLEERELSDDTIVVLWSDHGFLLGEHGLTAKSSSYRESMSAPLFMRAPGSRDIRPKVETKLAHALDVFPTLCELAGVEIPRGLAGRSLASEEGRDFVFTEQIGTWAAVRTARWKLVLGASRQLGLDQLYDLSSDPEENVNLILDPAKSETVRQLTAQMHAVFASSPPDWMASKDWMVRADEESAVRWAIAQVEPEGRPAAVRRRRAARKASGDDE